MPFSRALMPAGRPIDQGRELRERLRRDLDPAEFDFRHVEDAVDKGQQMPARTLINWDLLAGAHPASSSSWAIISEKPMMAFSGVRNSWLMVARKRIFAASACSAALRARSSACSWIFPVGDVAHHGDDFGLSRHRGLQSLVRAAGNAFRPRRNQPDFPARARRHAARRALRRNSTLPASPPRAASDNAVR